MGWRWGGLDGWEGTHLGISWGKILNIDKILLQCFHWITGWNPFAVELSANPAKPVSEKLKCSVV